MNRKTATLVLIVLCMITSTSAFAETITVTVKGMVCSFCAQGIKKTVGNMADVESVDVDLDKKTVIIKAKDQNSLTEPAIEATIKDAGYDVLKIERVKNP